MTLTALAAIWLVHLLAAISPGPAVLLSARTALSEGMARGAWLSVGIGLGACIWAIAALLGLAMVFRAAPLALSMLKFGGAAYLLWLAYLMWRDADAPFDETRAQGNGAARGALGLVWLGIATQLANPKPAVFFGAIFLNFIPPAAPVWALALVIGIVFVNDAGWNILVARIFSLPRMKAVYLGLKSGIDRAFGGLLALLGLNLALN